MLACARGATPARHRIEVRGLALKHTVACELAQASYLCLQGVERHLRQQLRAIMLQQARGLPLADGTCCCKLLACNVQAKWSSRIGLLINTCKSKAAVK